ncbi:MAG TPA: metallophosphoesterase [Nocardioides sp.]|nr:metallophosphoesterase [Nocardioides sp.]
MPETARQRVLRYAPLASRVTAHVAVWAVLACAAGAVFFLLSSRSIVLASHDAEVRPDLNGYVVVHTGPVLPDFRKDSGHRVGVDIRLGKTEARSTEELVRRYGYIASQPEGQVDKVERALDDMALDAAVRGGVVGLAPVLVWLLVGSSRRRELLARARRPEGAIAGAVVVLLVLGLWEPWDVDEARVESAQPWVTLGQFVGPGVPLPAEAAGIEVRGDITTSQTRRLVESAIDTYDKSKTFYATAAEAAAGLPLHQPEEGDTVVTLVSDRHDNIGMDAVARAVGDNAGAIALFDAGDDTSSGKNWEAFSLDSVTAAFDDQDRWVVAGNHDHGSFVSNYLDDRGWTVLDGHVVDGPGGTSLFGIADPRSSGLGNWRDETGLTFDEVASRVADEVCASEERVTTLLVHDADLGTGALERGCVDLVLAGHTHVQVGPSRVVGTNGQAGYTYTTGTTGGAAYAIAVGSKPKREAQISLITYRDGRPVGIQPVLLQSDGRFAVRPYIQLHLRSLSAAGDQK